MSEQFDHPVLDEVKQALIALQEAEAAAKQAFLHLQNAVTNLPQRIGQNTELRHMVITHLYWNEQTIRQTWIGSAFGIHNYQLKEIAGQRKTLPCKRCQKPMEIYITNREGRTWNTLESCQECSNKSAQLNTSAYKAYLAEQEQYKQYLHTMPYRDYLQTPEWQEQRTKAMKRAGFRCQVCNAYGVRLNVHHRTYEHRGYEYASDLITLCEDCHTLFHENSEVTS